MKLEIETALQPLIGEPFSDMMRYGGCQKFEFGQQHPIINRKGKNVTVGEWGLVAACD